MYSRRTEPAANSSARPGPWARGRSLALVGVVIVATAGVAATCSGSGTLAKPMRSISVLYLSNLSGAFEPCGCEPGQLGGVDRMLTLAAEARATGAGAVFVGAGSHAVRGGEDDARTTIRASLMSDLLRLGGFEAAAPGLAEVSHLAHGHLGAEPLPYLAANIQGVPALVGGGAHIARPGGVPVGFVGVVFPLEEELKPPLPEGVVVADPAEAVRAGVADARAKGAVIVVVLADGEPVQARKLAAAVPGIDFIVAGRSERAAEFAEPIEGTGTLLVQAGRDGEYLGVLSFHVPEGAWKPPLADGDDAERAKRDLTKLRDQVAEIERRMAEAVASGASTGDLGPLLERKRAEEAALLARIEAGKEAPAVAYFKHRLVPVMDDIEGLAEARKRIEEYTLALAKLDFDEEEPVPEPAEGKPTYAGAESCKDCHKEEYKHWKEMPHAHAMVGLEEKKRDKVAECVSCHAAGFRKPGGSSLHDMKGLAGVQCENCHGPSSLHNAAGGYEFPKSLKLTPTAEECAALCHHPPHDSNFDYEVMLLKGVLGPGHGDKLAEKLRVKLGIPEPETAPASEPAETGSPVSSTAGAAPATAGAAPGSPSAAPKTAD